MRLHPVLLLAALAACGPDRTAFTVTAPDGLVPALKDFAEQVPFPVNVDSRAHGGGLDVRVAQDLDCGDCYRIDAASGERYTLHAGSVLGAQYALAELLEAYGFGFFHPNRTRAPARLSSPLPGHFGVQRTPAMTRRGYHLHTLHPIEAYYAFWEPSDEHLAQAKKIIDWEVKNRGNFLEWPGLDDIQRDSARAAAWTAHTRAILDYAHERGLQVGFGPQLFGQSNLQKAFDLLDAQTDPPNPRQAMADRLRLPLSLPFDSMELSFGEFSGADPQRFIDRVNDAYGAAQDVSPGIEVTALVHVGKDNTVVYNGQTIIYYLLVQYADPRIVPWIHTVMYYDLFEDAGGAYKHDDFSEHRAYLLSRLAAGQRAAYFPEAAYWVAFDNSVPVYLPLYVRSRWLDISRIGQSGPPLTEHVLFSTGFEWGYWQTDAAVLRMGFGVPDSFQGALAPLFESYGPPSAKIVDAIGSLAEAQHDALIIHRAAAYYAAQDSIIDTGKALGIVSQPQRPAFSDLPGMTAEARGALRDGPVASLRALADASDAARAALGDSGAPLEDPFIAELADGMEIDALRAKFAYAIWSAALTWADGGDPASGLADADAAFAQARVVVNRRVKGMHAPDPGLLVHHAENQTLYPYGYLFEGQTLCYWDRERLQLRAAALGSTDTIPGCIDVDPQ